MSYFQDAILYVIAVFSSLNLAIGIGANDVPNAFGCSVGAGILSLKMASLLTVVFEILGAVLIAEKVATNLATEYIEVESYTIDEILLCHVAASLAASIWLHFSTYKRIPISGTHTVVGGAIGAFVYKKYFKVLRYVQLAALGLKWILTPILAAIISSIAFLLIKSGILKNSDPVKKAIAVMPILYSFVWIINFASILFFNHSPFMTFLGIPQLSAVLKILVCLISCVVVAISVKLTIVPNVKKKIFEITQNKEIDDIPKKKSEPTKDLLKMFNVHRKSKRRPRRLSRNTSTNSSCTDCNSKMNSILNFNSDFRIYSVPSIQNFPEMLKKINTEYYYKHSSCTAIGSFEPKINIKRLSIPICEDLFQYYPEVPTSWDCTKDVLNNRTYKITFESTSAEIELFRLRKRDKPEVVIAFKFLLILTSCFGAFAHGANDVGNAVIPLAFLLKKLIKTNEYEFNFIWFIYLFGAAGIGIGLFFWGSRIIKTMSKDLTEIVPSSVFAIEIGSAIVVLCASNLGIPVSTTHCKVGSLIGVGYTRTKRNVDVIVIKNIIFFWILTIPATALLSCGVMVVLDSLLLYQ